MVDPRRPEPELEEIASADILEEVPLDREVHAERISLLSAAQNARSVAMLTGTHGVVAPPLSRAALRPPPARALSGDGSGGEGTALAELLAARVSATARAASKEDAVARYRALLELAYATLDAGDAAAARAHATEAAKVLESAPAAHALLRTLASSRAERAEQLAHVEHLVAHGGERVRADFLAEKGRLLDLGASAPAFEEALAAAPAHAGALYGLEAALDATERWADLAAHLARVAELAGSPEASAWLHVERAILLDRRLEDPKGARAAFDQALALAPGIGPVRDAAVDHAVLHRDDARIASLLEAEAALERDAARAARLELDAALAWLAASGEDARARKLLEHAHGRAPTSKLTDARVADVLVGLLEREERWRDVVRVRQAALRNVDDPGEELVALRAIAAAAERAGELDTAVLALERARVAFGDDQTLLSELDRILLAAGRHEARAVLWMRESARTEEPDARARALLVAAAAARAGGRDADAKKYMQTAWVSAPGAPGAFDALAERLAVAGDRDAVPSRVALYEQAARATDDRARKLYYLEKIAWLWDDVAGDPAAAARAYEQVLAIDGARTSAIAGLASAAARAGDGKRSARALLAEAGASSGARRDEARLRAAEALAVADADRALALAEELRKAEDDSVATRAAELVTRLHAEEGRWEMVAKTLRQRRDDTKAKDAQIALALAEADVLATRLGSHERALAALADAPADPTVASATVASLEAIGDGKRLREELERLAASASSPLARALRLVRAAELAAADADDASAARLYDGARAAMPDDPLPRERLLLLGARANVPDDPAPAFVRAVRELEKKDGAAEPLLAADKRAFCTLRLAERFARRSGSAPLLANALAMQIDLAGGKGLLAERALFGVATLVAWTLPETEDVEPWDRLLAAGTRDAAALDTLGARARRGVVADDTRAIQLATDATKRRLEIATDNTERLVLSLELARLARRRGEPKEASARSREALAIDAWSVTAAVLLGELAGELGNRRDAIAAATALADVTLDAKARARLLADAADLSEAEGDAVAAATLLERALAS
ncbi:MAG TPA: hypothetical protein VIF62_38900, partial [Labilithrix sp.]